MNEEELPTTPTQNGTPKTVQTGQRPSYFEVAQDEIGNWHWMLWSGNGRQIATNVEPYRRQNDATNAVKTMMANLTPRTAIYVSE